ncbi:hypothetical protein EMCRGX_G015999 [Ephydatia muelleri]
MAVPAVEPHSGDQEQCGKLLQAVTNGDSLVVRSLLKAQNDLVRHTDLNGNTLLHIACEQKQFKVIGELVRAGVNVRERNSSGDTALHIAAGSTSKGKVIRLLFTEDTLNSKGSGGRTPLHRACQAGMLEAAKELVVELKCDVTATDDEGRTGLHVASAGGYLEIVKHLLAADLVQLKDACGYTALHYACEGGHDKIVKLLCKSDADIAVRNSNNETPLDVAALNGWNKVVDYILSKGRCCKDITGVKGRSALHHACAQGHVRLAEELIKKHQCNICAGDDNEMTPLHLASANGTEVLVELLASTSTPSTSTRPDQYQHQHQHREQCGLSWMGSRASRMPERSRRFKRRTCFHHACTGGCETAVKTLVEKHRFDPKEKDGHGVSPIQMAALHGKSNIVTLLESTYGCSFMESPSHFLAALLQYSCQEGSISMLKLALKIGADPNQRIRPQGGSALHYACEHGHPLVTQHLTSLYLCDVNKGDDNSCTPLHVASSCGHVEAVRELGRCAGLLVDSAEKAGLTPLHYACYKGHTRVVKALIELGANLQVCSLRKGWSILHSAAYGGQEDVMNMLINEYNCDPRAVDKRGRLPFHTACIAGHVKLVRALVQKYDYDVKCKDTKGLTPLHLASSSGHEELVVELVQNFKSELAGMFLRALQTLGANMNALVTGGNGLLHLAALNGHSRVVKFLVEECKMNVMSPGYCGRSVLHCVCDKGGQRQLHLLNELIGTYNLDINVVDEKGWTPLHVASAYGNEEVVRLLLNTPRCEPYSKAQDGLLAIEQACIEGHVGSVLAFLEYNSRTENSRTQFSNILHYVCQGGHTELMRVLVEGWKFDVNKQDTNGRTPLHIAILYEKEGVVRQLLTFKCQIDCVDSKGFTPLFHAVKRNKLNLVQMLLQFGAATDITANDGSTPLIHAVQQGYQDIFEVLVGKCKPTEIFNSFKSLESQKKELEDQLQRSKYQLLECEEKWKVQEKVDRRRSSDDVYKIKQEMAALRDQRKLGNDIIAERCSTGFPVKSLSSEADLALVVNELANKVPLQWKEVCSKLGTTLKCLQDIEREGCKYCYMMALMDLKELNKFTLAGVIDVLKSLGCDDIATSLHNDSQQRSTNNDSVEQSLPVHFSSRSSFEPVTSLASCGRNSAFLSEGTAAPEDQTWFGAIIEETVTFSTSPS